MQNNSVLFALVITAVVTIGGIALGSVLQRTVNEPRSPGIAKQSEKSGTDSSAPDRLNGVNNGTAADPASEQAQKQQESSSSDISSQNNNPGSPTTGEGNARTAISEGVYEPYDEAVLIDNDASVKLIYLNSVDCEVCRAFEEDILKSGVPKDVAIYHADYEEQKQLANRYGAKEKATVVRIDNEGQPVKSHVLTKGTASLEKVLNILK